jgi:hypothetical protein
MGGRLGLLVRVGIDKPEVIHAVIGEVVQVVVFEVL